MIDQRPPKLELFDPHKVVTPVAAFQREDSGKTKLQIAF